MNTNLVNIIFGLKVRQARMDAKLSLSKFAARCDLSPSYVTEIEKGRKYPKTDKILKMAEVLEKGYDELVSIKLDPSLAHLETILSSPLLQQFPFDAFDLDVSDLVGLFTRAPDKASALMQVALEVGRQYDMKDEHFLRAALRSYQEIHDNYFQEIEDKAVEFAEQYNLAGMPLPLAMLEQIIRDEFGYGVDEMELANHEVLSNYRSVFIDGTKPKLLINASLRPHQMKFVLAREMGYQFLDLKERANTSAPDRVDSFDQVLNDFKASYFAGALLMPRSEILVDLQAFFHMNAWSPYRLLNLLEKYGVTPEMLLYRFSELIPQFFGIRIHFLRFQHNSGYRLVKQLNMNRLLLPSGVGLHEHHCRRWLPIRLLKEMEADNDPHQFDHSDAALVGAQISEFLDSKERFLSFGFARPLALDPEMGSSVVIGFRLAPDLRRVIRFVEDPTLPIIIINETCERCPLTADQCSVRGAEPSILQAEKQRTQREAALRQLVAQLQE